MVIEETVQNRIKELLDEAQTLRGGDEYGQAQSEFHVQQCAGWIAAARNIVELVVPDPASGYRESLEKLANEDWGYAICSGVGQIAEVLSNLKKDADSGLVASVADRARAEVFDDFLDHAKAYLKDGHSKRAGVIGGVVFEDTIRRVCRKHQVDEHGQKLDELISVLTKKNVFTPLKAKRARAAAHVRTKATHAQWDEFDENDVQSTIEFTGELILRHIEN